MRGHRKHDHQHAHDGHDHRLSISRARAYFRFVLFGIGLVASVSLIQGLILNASQPAEAKATARGRAACRQFGEWLTSETAGERPAARAAMLHEARQMAESAAREASREWSAFADDLKVLESGAAEEELRGAIGRCDPLVKQHDLSRYGTMAAQPAVYGPPAP
jgi:hypothetical protein